jgi:transposase
MRVELPDQRGQSITMIGALSTQRGLFHNHTFASTNTSGTFIDFVVGLKAKCQGRTCIVVMDNLCVHKTKTVQGLFDSQFQQMFLPPQSCELNLIEKAWNIIKSQWRKTSYLILENNQKTEAKIADSVRMLQGIAEKQDLEKMKIVAHCNHKAMALTLRGYMV